MKYILFLVFLIGCSSKTEFSNKIPILDASSGNIILDATSNDIIVDSGIDKSLPDVYIPCVSLNTSQTNYPRLIERFCADSNNDTYLVDYFDTQLNILCNWNSGNDLIERCLPENTQSSPIFSDPSCTSLISGVLAKSSIPEYVSIGNYNDLYTVYGVNNIVNTNGIIYLLQNNQNNQWFCNKDTFYLSGVEFVSLDNNPINLNIFVQK